MQKGKFNVVTDGNYGSTGKGHVSSALVYRYRPEILTNTNMANAGHTAVSPDGSKFVSKALPAPTIMRKWLDKYDPTVIMGATSAFKLDTLQAELDQVGHDIKLMIHDRAAVITKEHQEREACGSDSTKHVASTMQGCATCLSDKILRKQDVKLARDYAEIAPLMASKQCSGMSLPEYLTTMMRGGMTILHEGSQGFGLDINHGSHYPQCTSRSTTAIQNLSDLGLPHQCMGDVYLVLRCHPIRVGNVIEDGKVIGYSGDCYPDQHELTIEQIAAECGAPPDVIRGIEITTVTKRQRRMFSFSAQQAKQAALSNGATKLVLTFVNYIDWSCYGVKEYNKLPQKVQSFVHKIEDELRLPVVMVGTGPAYDDVCII
jgi:adenylosuccinate synthase